MDNPFRKRATEHYRRDDEAFLAVVSPEPLTYFLGAYAEENQLYDRLVTVQGTPGSGKTTLAHLFEYHTLSALLRNPDAFSPLLDAMVECRAIHDDKPLLVGCRLSLETDYRDFWEFPYPNEVKLGLMTTLIQSRAVQGWIQSLAAAGVETTKVKIVPRDDAGAAAEMIGGPDVASVQARAQSVELAIYRIVAALIPPSLNDLEPAVTVAYRPFDVIDHLLIPYGSGASESQVRLTPLVILDDAHLLHPNQFDLLRHWLMRRELRAARWVMTRLDILQPYEALASVTEDRTEFASLPGITSQRDVIEIFLQGSSRDRGKQRSSFRRMAKDMANRYLLKMPVFSNRGHQSLGNLLSPVPDVISASKLAALEASVQAVQKRLQITDTQHKSLLNHIDAYHPEGRDLTQDVRVQMLSILMHRLSKKPSQRALFDIEDIGEGDQPATPVKKVDASVFEAACLQLYHKHGKPFYFGIDDLCDAGSENAEQFLRLAAILVEQSAVRLIRSNSPSLDAGTQHRLLTQQANDMIRHWNFPQHKLVRAMVDYIGNRCVEVTMQPNGWLRPNAYGVLQSDFDEGISTRKDLASVLHFAVAYNAISLVPNYSCKNQVWCLLELGGLGILHHGLSLKRGGFLEGSIDELALVMAEKSS